MPPQKHAGCGNDIPQSRRKSAFSWVFAGESTESLRFAGGLIRGGLEPPAPLRFDRDRPVTESWTEGVLEGVCSRCAAARKQEVEEGDVRGMLLRAQRP